MEVNTATFTAHKLKKSLKKYRYRNIVHVNIEIPSEVILKLYNL